MFLPSWIHHVEAFTPPALPGFFAKPASIATAWALCLTPLFSCLRILRISGSILRTSHAPPGLYSSSLDLLDAVYDPGAGTVTHPLASAPVACGYSHFLGLSQLAFSGLSGFSVLHFTSQSYCLADSRQFGIHSAWLGLSIGRFALPERRPFPGLRLLSDASSRLPKAVI